MTNKPVTASTMSQIDRLAREEFGVAETVLMENAGKSVADIVIGDHRGKSPDIAVICGKGNNGGDGFVAARYLNQKYPGKVTVYLADGDKIKEGASQLNFEALKRATIPLKNGTDFSAKAAYDVIIDSIFGIGFRGELPPPIVSLTAEINRSKAARYAVDVPSGLDATTGMASPGCVMADKTITFGLAKTGFYIGNGPRVCGEVIVVNIGFPEELLRRFQ